MRETRADTAQAFVLALLLHIALFALMFVGLWWTRSATPQSAAGSPLSAELIDQSDLSAPMRRTLARRPEPVKPKPAPPQVVEEEAAPLPQPIPEPRPQESPVPQQQQAQDFVPEPTPVEQEKVDRDAISAETREREQEEKRRQEQIDLTERKKQEEAEKKFRLAEQQRDEKLKKIQAERARLQREADLAEQKLKQIADLRATQASNDAAASAPPPPGNEGVDPGLKARYAAAIQEAVLRNWTRPENVPIGQRCRIYITQLPGGDVMSAKVDPSCPYDELGRRSVEAAVLKAKPLPYAGFESVFQRNLILNFEAQDR
ncbi:MAG TPA: cell envelope integrity protein TolA [Luteimonas sp.]|nr:cell envelope integrity protein TolA [Luteimonas sp.]